jgi:hypothetical protein
MNQTRNVAQERLAAIFRHMYAPEAEELFLQYATSLLMDTCEKRCVGKVIGAAQVKHAFFFNFFGLLLGAPAERFFFVRKGVRREPKKAIDAAQAKQAFFSFFIVVITWSPSRAFFFWC